jgi:hypothetical protein
MFPATFFAKTFFAGTYFPPVTGSGPEPPTDVGIHHVILPTNPTMPEMKLGQL